MKRLISLINTEGKSPEQLGQELYQNYLKYQKVSKTPPVNKPKKYTGKYSNLEIVESEEGLVTQILGYPVPRSIAKDWRVLSRSRNPSLRHNLSVGQSNKFDPSRL